MDALLFYRKRLRHRLNAYVPPRMRAARIAEQHNAKLNRPQQYQRGGWVQYVMAQSGPETLEARHWRIDQKHYLVTQPRFVMKTERYPLFTPHILVIDLEATCDEGDGLPSAEMEIIEIGAVWATADGEVLDSFEALIRPVVHPQLSAFCSQLTGIQQAEVDGADLFSRVAQQLADFAQKHPSATTWGSWGKFDAKQLAQDCERHGTPHPLPGLVHVNLKRQFAKARKIKEVGMGRALQMVDLPLDGAHHRGLSDAKNIAKLLPWCPLPSPGHEGSVGYTDR